ncbi:MAG: CmcJ/NvfI family oxidoreductase [Acidimicrobiales bacterium]
MTASAPAMRTTSVEGELWYLAPGSTVLRRFTAPGESVNTGRYEPHVVPVRDARRCKGEFSVGVQGFELLEHPSAVGDFTDKTQIDSQYAAEVVALVKERLGADAVVPRGWITRRAESPGAHGAQPQAALVHIDYGPEGAVSSAASAYAEVFPDGPPYRRAVATSVWRVFSPPPQDWPLALCDFRSVDDTEGLANQLYFVDRVPEDPFGPVDGMTLVTSGSEFHFCEAHEWWYFPDMTRDEVLFFVFNDSDHSRAWRVPHTAFRDPTVGSGVPRHSIEFRSFAYFR